MLKYKRLLTVVFPSKVKPPILQPTALIWTWRHKSGSEENPGSCSCWFGMPAGVALAPSLKESVVSGLQLRLHVRLLSVTCEGAGRPHGTDGVERREHIAPLHFEVLRQKRGNDGAAPSLLSSQSKLKHGGSCGGCLGWKVTILFSSFRDGGRCFHCLKVVITPLFSWD